MPTLILKFDSPIQSWGTSLKLTNHDTGLYPSKSGVIGMIASALGRRRDESIDDLSVLRFGVMIENQGTIIDDFQVSEVSASEKKTGHRKYLSDAVFICGIEGPENIINDISFALRHPANALFAGRRGCPVTAELLQKVVPENLKDALRNNGSESMRIIVDAETPSGVAVRDLPLSFSPYDRQYTYRFIEEL